MARFGNKDISQNAFLLWLLLEVCKLKIGPIFPKNYIKLRPDITEVQFKAKNLNKGLILFRVIEVNYFFYILE